MKRHCLGKCNRLVPMPREKAPRMKNASKHFRPGCGSSRWPYTSAMSGSVSRTVRMKLNMKRTKAKKKERERKSNGWLYQNLPIESLKQQNLSNAICLVFAVRSWREKVRYYYTCNPTDHVNIASTFFFFYLECDSLLSSLMSCTQHLYTPDVICGCILLRL